MSDAPTAAESAERTREAERHLAEADELLRDQLEALDIAGKALVDAARSEAERIAALEDEVREQGEEIELLKAELDRGYGESARLYEKIEKLRGAGVRRDDEGGQS